MPPRAPAKNKVKRFLPTTFNFKDVLVILTTAITAASPFFMFDTKFGIMENQIANMQSDVDQDDARVRSLTEQLYHVNARLQVLEETRSANIAEIAQLNQKVVELNATIELLRQRRR